VHTIALVLVVIAAALLATGLMHLLMLGTLRPRLLFGWIVALMTAIMVARIRHASTLTVNKRHLTVRHQK